MLGHTWTQFLVMRLSTLIKNSLSTKAKGTRHLLKGKIDHKKPRNQTKGSYFK